MNSRHYRCIRRDSRFEIVLGFVVVAVQEVVQAKVEFDSARNLLRQSKIEDGMARCNNSRVIAIKPIVINGAHSKRATPAMPGSERERRVRHEVRGAVHVESRARISRVTRFFRLYYVTTRRMDVGFGALILHLHGFALTDLLNSPGLAVHMAPRFAKL